MNVGRLGGYVLRFLCSILIACFCMFGSVCFADMEVGHYGPEVLEVQKKLSASGFKINVVDGIYDEQTENAVKSYQYENKLEMTGKVDKDLYRKLLGKDLPDRFSLSAHISLIRRILGSAVALQGIPYVFGGTTPNGFDCSGFVQYVFRQAGINLPRMADEQSAVCKSVTNPQEGDLVFFQTYAPGVSHIGISLGGNRFIHASSSKGITISSLDEDYWANHYIGAGTIIPGRAM